jgi:hypothetical protein
MGFAATPDGMLYVFGGWAGGGNEGGQLMRCMDMYMLCYIHNATLYYIDTYTCKIVKEWRLDLEMETGRERPPAGGGLVRSGQGCHFPTASCLRGSACRSVAPFAATAPPWNAGVWPPPFPNQGSPLGPLPSTMSSSKPRKAAALQEGVVRRLH